ncbi:MAG: leucine-rich repeat protein [Lachnospiraceae bacterium]|nr:leucine-rich repeat protein [Lachnospiraceae bacterium]
MYKKALSYILALTCIYNSYNYQSYNNNSCVNNILTHTGAISNKPLKSAVNDNVITDISISAYGELFSFKGSGKLIIDKNVKSISSYVFCDKDITSIEVSKDNKYFKAVDGVLYNKNMTKLVYYPSLKEGDAFTISDKIKNIEEYAFSNNKFLKNIFIGKNIKDISWTSFDGCKANFNVDENSPYLESSNGILYTKGKETLIKYPALKEGTYIIPGSVKKIQYYALDNCTGLTELVLNENMEDNAFSMVYLNGCTSLERLHLPASLKNIEFDDAGFDKDYYGGYNLRSLKEITISDENTEYAVYNGALYSKNYEQLYFIPAGMDKLVIHENVQKINTFLCQNKFTEVKIPETNKNFVSYKGVLYDKDMSEIVIFPSTMTEYELPASVESITRIMNDFSIYPKAGVISKYTRMAGNVAFFTVEKGNKLFSAQDGVLYNKEKTLLYIYPAQKKDKKFTIPGSVTSISTEAFASAHNLEEINFPGSVKRIYTVFEGCTSLKKVIFNEGTETVCVYGSTNKDAPLDIGEIYLPGTLSAIDTDNFGISKNVIFYGYKNTGDEQFATCSNMPINSAAWFIKQNGYKFKSLGTAPKAVSNTKCSKGKNIIKISWKAGSKSDGYVIYKEYNAGLVAIKKINNGSKYSCTIKNNKLEGLKGLYIRPYKKINGIKVYGRKTKITI